VLHIVDARPHIDERPEHRMRDHIFDALAIDPDLAAVADRVPVLRSCADHLLPIGSVIVAWHSRAEYKARQPAVARAAAGTSRAVSSDRFSVLLPGEEARRWLKFHGF
jgi:hypothetical protein